ncbi:integrase core domain-containing protein [Hymenobacter tenuis]
MENAPAESLWLQRKAEELKARERHVFRDLADAHQSVAAYFDYYNHDRRHSAVAYQSSRTF